MVIQNLDSKVFALDFGHAKVVQEMSYCTVYSKENWFDVARATRSSMDAWVCLVGHQYPR